jgi:AcrR family transcriptional regulator
LPKALPTLANGSRAHSVRLSHDERRLVILKGAIRLFSERGFRGTTTRDLAAAAGISEPVLYEHFRSKRDLYEAIVETKARERMEKAHALIQPYIEAKDDRGFFREAGEFILKKFDEDEEHTRLNLMIALEGSELVELFTAQIRAVHDLFADYIRARISDGAFRPVNPRVAARSFLCMFAHHGLLTTVCKDRYLRGSRKRIVHQMVDLFLGGLTNTAPAGAAPEGNDE